MPHAASLDADIANSSVFSPRDIDVLFCGSIPDPEKYREKWKSFPKILACICDQTTEILENNPLIAIEEAVCTILKTIGMEINSKLMWELFPALQCVDHFIRADRRVRCLTKLSEAGINLHVYGSLFHPSFLASYKNVVKGKTVLFPEALKLMRRAKIVLNIMPNFPHGSHERIFSAMLNGAVSVTDSNLYFSAEFRAGVELVFFSWQELENLPGIINGLLSNTEQWNAISRAGQREVQSRHSWSARAKDIISLLDSIH